MDTRNAYTNSHTTGYGAIQSPSTTIPNLEPAYHRSVLPGLSNAEDQPLLVPASTVATTSTTNLPPNFTATQTSTRLSRHLGVQSLLGNTSTTIRQIKSVGSASLILITGGMNIAWSCGFAAIIGYQRNVHIIICWYIAAIFGAIIGSFITNRMPKKPIYMFAAFLVLIGGIFTVSLPHVYAAVAAARYLNGFAVGLVIVPMLVLVGDEVNSVARGSAAALIEMTALTFGIFLQIIFFATFELNLDIIAYEYHFGSNHLNGICAIFLSVMTIVCSHFYVIESPIYYLLHNNENQALQCLRQLQHSQQAQQQLEEHKLYIECNSSAGDRGISAVLKLCLYRALIALSFSPFTTAAIQLASILHLGPSNTVWPCIVYGLMLWIGASLAGFLMDSVGRKKLMLGGVLISGGLAIGIGSILDDLENIVFNNNMGIVLYMLFFLQLFAGVLRSSSSAYLTEAFPLHLKPYYISIAFTVEMLVMLIMGSCFVDVNNLGGYFITLGILYLIFFCLAILSIPEVKKLTLLEAQAKFTNFTYSSF